MRYISSRPFFTSSFRTLAAQFVQPPKYRPSRYIFAGSARSVSRLTVIPTPFLPRAAFSTSTIPAMETVDTSSRLTELRALMKERKVDVYSKKRSETLRPFGPDPWFCLIAC